MTASRLRLVAVGGGLFIVGPGAAVALWSRGWLLGLALAAMAVLALLVVWDNLRLSRSLREQRAVLGGREREVHRLASYDALTGLPNRAAFAAEVEAALQRRSAEAEGAPSPSGLPSPSSSGERRGADHVAVSVLVVDLDDFRAVNITLGHDAGDQLLIEVAARVTSIRWAGGVVPVVARLGGDEFAVLLEGPGTDPGEVASEIHAALRAPFSLAGGHMAARATIGIAGAGRLIGPRSAEPGADTLLRQAEIAVGAAKGRGAGGTQVYSPDLTDGVASQALLRAALASALDADALELWYQPIVELVTGRVWGVEALSRWTDEERGPVAPAEFIPLSEESGLIHQLGRLVLAHACAEAVGWPGGPSAPVLSVNVSPSQLQDPSLVAHVADALAASGLPPERLMVEVPDAALLDQGRQGRDRLAALRELGVRVAVDGFGAGSSSLRHLPRFPVDVIKIDQALVRGIDDGPAGLAVLRAIVDLADQLGLDTVAEGIEEIRQADALASIGCRSGQGFWYRRPVPAPQLWPLPQGGVLRPRAAAH